MSSVVVKERLKYIDALKVLAILCIISQHILQLWWGKSVFNLDLFRILTEITRFGVPVFLMISGALLLNRDLEVVPFLKKKWIRLCYPFILYFVIQCLVSRSFVDIFTYNWYFWMILCVFLAIPIVNKFILNSSIRELEYFVLVIVASSILYQLLYFTGIRNFMDLGFFIGPLSYLILGYYFSVKDFNMKSSRIVTIFLVIFIAATLIKMAGVANMIPIELIKNLKATNNEIVASWLDIGFVEIVQTVSIFVFVRYLYKCDSGVYGAVKNFLETDWINRFFISVSRASYGMYLINTTFVFYSTKYFKHLQVSSKRAAFYSLMLILVTFILSWLIVVCISRIPKLKKFSGYA